MCINKRERKKKSFLAGHSAGEGGGILVSVTREFIQVFFFLHININIFLQPANSDTENGIKIIQKCDLKKII